MGVVARRCLALFRVLPRRAPVCATPAGRRFADSLPFLRQGTDGAEGPAVTMASAAQMPDKPKDAAKHKNWDKFAQEAEAAEKEEKKEGDDALNSLFQQIYKDGALHCVCNSTRCAATVSLVRAARRRRTLGWRWPHLFFGAIVLPAAWRPTTSNRDSYPRTLPVFCFYYAFGGAMLIARPSHPLIHSRPRNPAGHEQILPGVWRHRAQHKLV